jgi:hypothetical protein
VSISLSAISPIAFELAKEGDFVSIKKKAPNKAEYRGTLEAARDVFLVFKGVTKVGMIPSKVSDTLPDLANVKTGKIIKMDQSKMLIQIQL